MPSDRNVINKEGVKVKLPLCLTKQHAMKTYLLLNETLHYEDVLRE